jgi:hypothetical protein
MARLSVEPYRANASMEPDLTRKSSRIRDMFRSHSGHSPSMSSFLAQSLPPPSPPSTPTVEVGFEQVSLLPGERKSKKKARYESFPTPARSSFNTTDFSFLQTKIRRSKLQQAGVQRVAESIDVLIEQKEELNAGSASHGAIIAVAIGEGVLVNGIPLHTKPEIKRKTPVIVGHVPQSALAERRANKQQDQVRTVEEAVEQFLRPASMDVTDIVKQQEAEPFVHTPRNRLSNGIRCETPCSAYSLTPSTKDKKRFRYSGVGIPASRKHNCAFSSVRLPNSSVARDTVNNDERDERDEHDKTDEHDRIDEHDEHDELEEIANLDDLADLADLDEQDEQDEHESKGSEDQSQDSNRKSFGSNIFDDNDSLSQGIREYVASKIAEAIVEHDRNRVKEAGKIEGTKKAEHVAPVAIASLKISVNFDLFSFTMLRKTLRNRQTTPHTSVLTGPKRLGPFVINPNIAAKLQSSIIAVYSMLLVGAAFAGPGRFLLMLWRLAIFSLIHLFAVSHILACVELSTDVVLAPVYHFYRMLMRLAMPFCALLVQGLAENLSVEVETIDFTRKLDSMFEA